MMMVPLRHEGLAQPDISALRCAVGLRLEMSDVTNAACFSYGWLEWLKDWQIFLGGGKRSVWLFE